VPADKKLDAAWKAALWAGMPEDDHAGAARGGLQPAKGAPPFRGSFTGEQLRTIGMPCGGIAAGQLYVRGDGTLAGWWIANNAYNTGYGAADKMNFNTALGPWKVCYQTFTPPSYIDQGFIIQVGNEPARRLDKDGFHDIEFTGEYPIAFFEYEDRAKPLPVGVRLEVYSPFIPLDARESATPATILAYTITNNSRSPQTVGLSGIMQNMVGLDARKECSGGMCRNRIKRDTGMVSLVMDLVDTDLPANHPHNGNVSLTLLSGKFPGDKIQAVAGGEGRIEQGQDVPGRDSLEGKRPLGEYYAGSVGGQVTIPPGQSRQMTFLLTWYFPNRPKYIDVDWNQPLSAKGEIIGNNYANWFGSSTDVARWLRDNLPRLHRETMNFHDAYYSGSTIPYWLKRRILMPMSTLATETCQWWGNGKFWAWEGVGSCVGTCTHVWNYEQGMAHLFPELERNVREQTDLSVSFQPNGSILARNGGGGVMIDGDAGTMLKAWREYQLSRDSLFLTRNWEHLKRAARYLIRVDSNADGLIETVQPNTYDIEFYGANTYVGSLYLGALRATEKMALLMHDTALADSCGQIAERGSENSSKRLFNGEYFIQDVDPALHPNAQYGKGCLSDQVFGQTWADLYGLGDLYPKEEIRSALRSVWKYNWAPDISVQTRHHKAERDYADPGEAGLLVCTWPHDPHPGERGVRYRDEVWTGIEYQVATQMIYEGMINEALSVLKGLDDRYQPEKHNPWNEVECGDHYARAMSSWGVLLALEGFTYDGPIGVIGLAPKIGAEKFQGFFSGAEGWGVLAQRRTDSLQVDSIHVCYGKLAIREVQVELPEGKVLSGVTVQTPAGLTGANVEADGRKLKIRLPGLTLVEGQGISVRVRMK
jgi:uncharacterized protein (DUF608 family)